MNVFCTHFTFFSFRFQGKQTANYATECKTADSKNVTKTLKILNGGELVHKSGLKWGENA